MPWQTLLSRRAVSLVRDYLEKHAELWSIAQQNVEALEEELRQAVQPCSSTIEFLRIAPHVGLIIAATYVAVVGTPNRFRHSTQLVSYLGMAPATYDSGSRVRHGHITKRGSAELRAMLCEAAQKAGDPRHPLHPYFARMCAREGWKRAVICVAQRLARIMYQMWRTNEPFSVKKLNLIEGKIQRTKTLYYRIKKTEEKAMKT
jgi:transposase